MATAVVALAVGSGACGGEQDRSASSSPSAQQDAAIAKVQAHNEEVREQYAERAEAEAPTPEEVEAEKTVTHLYSVLGRGKKGDGSGDLAVDARSFCDLMSEEARAQTVHYAEVASGVRGEWDCESAVDLLIGKRVDGFGEIRQAKVIGVNVVGEEATATVRFGDAPARSFALVKEDGEWKLAAAPVGSDR